MKILRKWSEISLVKRIIAGLIAGVILGLVLPETVPLGILGDVFVGALRALAPLLVFFIVMYSLSNHQKGQSSNMGRILILYAVSTVLAALTAVAASFIFPMEITLGETAEGTAPQGIGEVLESLVVNAVSNPIGAITEANYISVLVWAVIFGMALRAASDNTKDVLSNISDMLFNSHKVGYKLRSFRHYGPCFHNGVNSRNSGSGLLRQDHSGACGMYGLCGFCH